jgi:hypothetical protein
LLVGAWVTSSRDHHLTVASFASALARLDFHKGFRMKALTVCHPWLVGVLSVGLLVGVANNAQAQGGPVKVTIEHDNIVVGEGASLPIDPTPKVRFAYVNNNMMPGLAGINGERLTFSPQGGHDMLLQIDGQVSMIGQPPGQWTTLAKPLGKSTAGKQRIGVTSTWVMQKIHVTQVIELVPSKAPPKGGGKRQMDVMLLRYTIENKDSIAHQVGLRNTIDIFLIDNDGALFASPLTHPGQIINGHEFKGDKLPEYVQVLRQPNIQNPGYVTHFSFKLGKLEPPTRFVCTNLGACFQGGWDVPAQQAGDSAVAVFFDPKPIAAGAKREMAYAYGIGIASNPENEGRVTLQMAGSFEVAKEFTITAYVEDPLESQSLTLQLPAGLELVHGKPTQAVPAVDDTGNAVVMWKARVAKLGSHAIKLRSSNGVEYNSKLIIEPAPKGSSTSLLVQPLPETPAAPAPKQAAGAEPPLMEIFANLKAQGHKTALAYEELLLSLRKTALQTEEAQRGLEMQQLRLVEQQALVDETAAKLGAQNAKVIELRKQLDQITAQAEEQRFLLFILKGQLDQLQAAKTKGEDQLRKQWLKQNLPPSKLQEQSREEHTAVGAFPLAVLAPMQALRVLAANEHS